MKPRIVVPQSHAEKTALASSKLRAVTIALAITAAAAVVSTLVLAPTGPVRPWAVATLVGLAVAASQRVTIFGDETAINTSMVVLLASAGLTATGGPLWVPAACGIVAGLHWEHVRNFAVRRLVVNASCTTLAVIGASLVGRILHSGAGTFGLLGLIVGIGAVCIYWLVDNGLVAFVLSAVDESSTSRHLRDLTRSETQILPFALGGFLLAFVVLPRLGDLAFAASLLALVLLADLVVVRGRARRATRHVLSAAFVPITLLCIVAVIGLATVNDGIPTQAAFIWFLIAGLVGSLVFTRRAPMLTMGAPVACAIGAGLALGASHQFFAPIAIAISACLVPLIRLSTRTARLTLLCAAGVSSIATSWSFSLLPYHFALSFWGALLVGLTAGLAGLAGWHFVVALRLALLVDRAGWRVGIGNAAGDVAVFTFAGLIGGSSGWAFRHASPAASGILLALGIALALKAMRATNAVAPEPNLADDQLLDVIQSALLDLPASRLREE